MFETELTPFARALGEVIDLTLSGRSEEAQQFIRGFARLAHGEKKVLRAPILTENGPIIYNKRTLAMPSKARQAEVFGRDSYRCRYCNRSVIAIPVMNAVSAIYPTLYRAHPHGKAAETDVSFWVDAASVDHLLPLTRSGDNALPNLITACWRCNELKGNATIEEVGWSLTNGGESAWDGLSSKLLPLVGLIKRPRRYFRDWIRALEHSSRAI